MSRKKPYKRSRILEREAAQYDIERKVMESARDGLVNAAAEIRQSEDHDVREFLDEFSMFTDVLSGKLNSHERMIDKDILNRTSRYNESCIRLHAAGRLVGLLTGHVTGESNQYPRWINNVVDYAEGLVPQEELPDRFMAAQQAHVRGTIESIRADLDIPQRKNHLKGAIEQFKKAVSYDNDAYGYHFFLARAYYGLTMSEDMQSSEWKNVASEAIDAHKQLLRHTTYAMEYLYKSAELSDIYVRMGDYNAAIGILEEAIKKSPDLRKSKLEFIDEAALIKVNKMLEAYKAKIGAGK